MKTQTLKDINAAFTGYVELLSSDHSYGDPGQTFPFGNEELTLNQMRERHNASMMDLAACHWVSVADSMPDSGVEVLVSSDRNGAQIDVVLGAWDDNRSCWINAEQIRIHDVTHWMPLPGRPEVTDATL